jgi:hypothetical protein
LHDADNLFRPRCDKSFSLLRHGAENPFAQSAPARHAECVTIEYVFKLDDGQAFKFEVDTERTLQARFDKAEHPFWTKLDF